MAQNIDETFVMPYKKLDNTETDTDIELVQKIDS